MKCPECGQWNRISMPHCIRCGAPLNIDDASNEVWQKKLNDKDHGTRYIRFDENEIDVSEPDRRDILAEEMQALKKRKQEGLEVQEQIRIRREKSRAEAAGIIFEDPAVTTSSDHNSHHEMGLSVNEKTEKSDSRKELAQEKYRKFKEEEARRRIRIIDDNNGWNEEYMNQYDRIHTEQQFYSAKPIDSTISFSGLVPKKNRRRKILKKTLLIFALILCLFSGVYWGNRFLKERNKELTHNLESVVTASMLDGLAAHTILIPGEEGSQIYIRELHASYLVADGYATVEVADHTWYDSHDGPLDDTMSVTLTPFLKTSSGKQLPMDPIYYDIFIPQSPITLDSPDSLRTEVATTMSTIRITVRPGSSVTVNGVDCSDTVNSETGEMSYNATVQPIGNNKYEFIVRSQYCRDNSMTVVLYREPQEIPLDLAVGTYGTTDQGNMKVTASTMPGAYVEVLSSYADLDISELETTGRFSFNAVFDSIGYNTIIIESSYPGKKTSHVEHQVYYLPPASIYTVKAWPLTAEGYSELLGNIQFRADHKQVYLVTGIVQYIVSDKPQLAVINTSEDGKSQPVLVENMTKINWEVGKYYRIYADVSSTYNSMPWLVARYTYLN